MNKDQVKGRIKEAKGEVKEVTGKIVGNKTLEEKGKVQSTIGKVQAGYGDLKADLLVLALAGLQGCATGIVRMQAHLAAQVKNSIGLTLHQARFPEGIIEQRDPSELRMLANGHVLYIYRDYWLAKGFAAMPCDVFLEVNPKGQVIVNAYAKGSGCYSNQ